MKCNVSTTVPIIPKIASKKCVCKTSAAYIIAKSRLNVSETCANFEIILFCIDAAHQILMFSY